MLTVKTLNSTYEIDGTRVRRLGGDNSPTLRQGADGEWKEAESIEKVALSGHFCYMFVWETVGFVAKTTVTSPVISEEGDSSCP